MRQGDGDHAPGLGAGDAIQNIAPAQAGIDQHRHRAEFEQRECQAYEIDARRHHQQYPIALGHARAAQTIGQPVGILIELLKGGLGNRSTARNDEGIGPGPFPCQLLERVRDIFRRMGTHKLNAQCILDER